LFWPSPALASNSNSPLSSLKSALVLAKIPAHLCMTYFLTTPKEFGVEQGVEAGVLT
ncbi:MAG: hypothetical protein ACI9NC_004773, partial [Verrucomicrobiales bacterium]